MDKNPQLNELNFPSYQSQNNVLVSFFPEICLFLIVRMEIGFVLLQGVPLRKEEVALLTEEPVFRHRVRVVLIGVPVKIASPIKGVQADSARDSHAAKGDLGMGGCGVGLQDGHAGEVHLARGTHQPAIDDVFQMHLRKETIFNQIKSTLTSGSYMMTSH